jgi:hypothetical protein
MTESLEIRIGELEGKKIEGHLLGTMNPLMSLFRTCQTEVSRERELIIGEIFSGLREGNWGLLITDSLAHGMSIPESDVDFDLIDTKESSRVIEVFKGRLANLLPEVEPQFCEDHNLEEIERVVSFLEGNPEAKEDDVVVACKMGTAGVKAFLTAMTNGGLLLGNESEVVSLWQRARKLGESSSLLNQEGIRRIVLSNNRTIIRDRYLGRLKDSEGFKQLDLEAQKDLLGKIGEAVDQLK